MGQFHPGEREHRATRLAAAGAVGASVAHELRNALAVAESSLFLAQRDVDDRPSLLRHLDQVAAEIRKAHEVIGSVLGLARGEPVRREPASIAALVDVARHSLVLPTNVTFEVHVAPSDLLALCDPVLLERVFSNVYLNAIEVLKERGRGRIATRAWADAERTWIEVDDDGPGIDPHVAAHLFEPLCTGKAKGTGLGLALSRVILEAHGGALTAGPSASGGSLFRMWLPVA